MLYGTIFIPIVAILIAVIFFKKHFTLVEYAGLMACPLILVGISYCILNFIQTNDREYWSGWIVKAEYEEDWNE